MEIVLNKQVAHALEEHCKRNFRTPELQIMFWITQDQQCVQQVLTQPETIKKLSSPRTTRKWTEEQRAKQRERMKKQWAAGAIKPKKELDIIVEGSYDD
jgi:hypothetical protein